MIAVSGFASRLDNEPARVEFTWDQLVAALTDVEETPCTIASCLHSSCPHKMESWAWCPGTWPEGATRLKKTVSEVSLFIVDLDHLLPAALESALDRLEKWSYVMHASHSDTVEDRCVRVVFQVSRPILGAEFDRFWPAAAHFLQVPLDGSCKDASRLYYVPTRPRDACHEADDGSGFDYSVHEGAPLDVDTILAVAPPVVIPTKATIPSFKGAPSEEALEAAIEVMVSSWPPHGTHHVALLALSGALAHSGWPEDLIAEFCYQVHDRSVPGTGSLKLHTYNARTSVEKLSSGELTTGWPTMEGHVGEDAVKEVCKLLGIGLQVSEPLRERLIARAREGAKKQDKARIAAEARAKKEIRERSQKPVLDPTEVPTREKNRAALEILTKNLKKSPDVERSYEGKLLQKILKGESLSSHADEDKRAVLEQAALTVARGMLPGTPVQHLAEFLLPSAGALASDIHEIAEFAAEHARRAGPVVLKGPKERKDPDEPEDDEALRAQLDLSRDGDTRNCPHNIDRVLRYASDLNGHLRWNVITKVVEVTGGLFVDEPPNDLPIAILNWLGSRWGLSTSTEKVAEQLLRIARKDSYDPVEDYLMGLEWDGVSRIGSTHERGWLTTYCGAEDTIYARKVGARFLISAVARGLSPGCKVDTVLILEGAQGRMKSTAIKVLGGAWFSDTPLILGDKDSMMIAASKWIIELAELDSLARGEVSRHKAFLSAATDNFRPPYGRVHEEFQRHCVFFGTVNEDQYLQDPTGNRRYWAVKAERCLIERLQEDRDQLWAEAVVRFRSAHLNADQAHTRCPGERWWFLEEEQLEADLVIASRKHENPWASMIKEWSQKYLRPGAGAKAPPTHFTMAQVAEDALHISRPDMQRHVKAVTRALKEAGFESISGPHGPVWTRAGTVLLGQQCEPEDTSEVPGPPGSN